MDYEYFLQRIHGVIMLSTGCTELLGNRTQYGNSAANARGEVLPFDDHAGQLPV